MVSYTSQPTAAYVSDATVKLSGVDEAFSIKKFAIAERWLIFALSILLVSVPVFIQAPLVRFLPWFSVALTPLLWLLSTYLLRHPKTRWVGDLMIGFTWTWLAGSLYWGWLRWEPFLHLPVEAIGLPFALWGIALHRHRIGHFFYLGSLLGTAITDLYFYLMNLIPYWRQLMQVEDGDLVRPIFQAAIAQMQTPAGILWAGGLGVLLLVTGLSPLRSRQGYWWAFAGAVLSTILVDSLFWFAALSA